MKRKLLSIILIATMVFGGCGTTASTDGQSNVTVKDNRTTETEDSTNEDTTSVTVKDNRQSSTESTTETATSNVKVSVSDSDFDKVGYLYENSIGTTYYYLVITNNSTVPVSISGNGIAKDADGNSVGAGNMSIDILGVGETTIGYFYFSGVKDVANVDYSLSYDTAPYYYPVIGNLSIEQTLNDKNVTVSVTNNGDYPAQYVLAYCLFFDADNNITRTDWTYVTDGDSEIKPNATISAQLDNYNGTYDHAEVYFQGRGTGDSTWSASDKADVNDSDFIVKEYLYDDSYGSTSYYLAITNNSSEIVAINGNATAKDSNGNVLGADKMSIDVLAPDETTIGYFCFSNVSGVESVEYSLSYSEADYYSPIIGDLAIDESINNSNVILSITNNGNVAADFVQAYAIFLDEADNVVYVDWSYITDDDNEIKAGATLSSQLDCRETFDHVDVYLTGSASD
jgi:hypothetical protein